jgi:hypothetical protein
MTRFTHSAGAARDFASHVQVEWVESNIPAPVKTPASSIPRRAFHQRVINARTVLAGNEARTV